MRYAVLDDGGVVVNVAEWDGSALWDDAARAIQSDDASPGDAWDGSKFVKAVPSPPVAFYTEAELQELVAGVTSLAKAREVLALVVKGLALVRKP